MDDGLSGWALKQLIGNMRVQADPFGIYAERRHMVRNAGIKVHVYRGDEWWTRAADKIIQAGLS